MSWTRVRRAIGAALLTAILAVVALVAVTFEHRRQLGQPSTLADHIESLLDGWTTLVWPVLMLASIAFVAVLWVGDDPERPIKMMRRELEALTSSNLDRRVTPLTTGDELERFATTLNSTLDKLESAVLANERLVADAAHELRTPLTAVRAALEVQHIKAPGELLEDAITEVDRAGKLIDDLLLLARSPSTGSRLELVDLDDVVLKEIARFRREHPGVAVAHTIQPVQQRLAHQDVASLTRNLLENAAKYGGGAVNVTLHANEGHSRLTVEDNGPGIDEDKRNAVLDRFSRLDHARDRATGGSGLGLAIVNETAQAHGGEVAISDAALGGCQISVTFPLEDASMRTSTVGVDSNVAADSSGVGRRAFMVLSGAGVVATLIGTGYLLRPATMSSLASSESGLIDRSNWTVSTSRFDDTDPRLAIDGDIETRWTTGVPQVDNDMWFEIDLGADETPRRIELRNNEASARDFPRGYRVEIATSNGDFVEVAAEDGVIDMAVTMIEFEPQTARRIRIHQTGFSETQWWSISEISIFR